MEIEKIDQYLTSGGKPIFQTYKGYKICALPHKVLSIKPNFFRALAEGIKRESGFGTANGYIEIPEFDGEFYDDIPAGNIHGGWTFCRGDVFGFDTVHANSTSEMNEEWVLQNLRDYVDEVLIQK